MSDTAQGSWAGSQFGPTLSAYGLFPNVASLKDAPSTAARIDWSDRHRQLVTV